MKVVSVPLTAAAMERLDTDSCVEGDLQELVLGEDDFNWLWSTGVLAELNTSLEVLIDDFEDEHISFEKLNSAIKIIEKHSNSDSACLRSLKELMEVALKRETGVFFFF